MEDLSKKFDSFELLMTQALDKLSGMEAWKTTAEEATDRLLSQSQRLESRLRRLEAPPQPPLPPQVMRPSTAPPPPPSRWTDPFDLNLAPPPVTRPPASSGERPSGHRVETSHRDVGGGILGPQMPRPITSMYTDSSLPQSHHSEPVRDCFSRAPPLPKLEFPKFDGDNPRLWRDRCEMFFEVYSVGDHLKTHFVALNFKGAAASWLQTAERRGRSWIGGNSVRPFLRDLIVISTRCSCGSWLHSVRPDL